MDDKRIDLCVTCASGVESVLKKELFRLGYGDNPAENGMISFKGSALDIARTNINLRTADRVYLTVGETEDVLSFDALFDFVKGLKWEEYIVKSGKITVNGKCVKSQLFSISDCQKIVKKAIIERLKEKYKTSVIEENGETYEVVFSLYKDKATLMLNTSGEGLHKRGYRDLVGIAPIKETLASALLLMSDFYYKRPFIDPFCGSGTFVIEGAKIALDIPAGLDREFAFNKWKNYDRKYYDIAREEGLDKIKRDREIDFKGFDIDPKAVKLAIHHAERAGLKDKVRFTRCAVKDLKLDSDFGSIVTNPPYGERVFDKEEAEVCYKDLGKVLKDKTGWSLFVITAAKNFEKNFGKKAERKRKMFNSNKECGFYYYYGKSKKGE